MRLEDDATLMRVVLDLASFLHAVRGGRVYERPWHLRLEDDATLVRVVLGLASFLHAVRGGPVC